MTSSARRSRPRAADDAVTVHVHLIDGTYELFRFYYALPEHLDADGGGDEVVALKNHRAQHGVDSKA